MSFVIIGIVTIIVCWKLGDWRHWKQYYSTILYLMIGDLAADFLLSNIPLFAFGPLAEKSPTIDIIIMLLLYPSTVILYLTFYPKPFGKQVVYILMWVGIYTAFEIIADLTGGFCYYNGWNLLYSILFDLGMFSLLALHYKKPLFVWPISAALCFLLLWWFRIPLST
jgi:hypothetical protein